jgi:hypothetical protein
MHNLMYQANGSSSVDQGALQRLALADFDAACMFSVITHQLPKDSGLIFSMLLSVREARRGSVFHCQR